MTPRQRLYVPPTTVTPTGEVVSVTGTPQDGDVPVRNGSGWVPGTGGGAGAPWEYESRWWSDQYSAGAGGYQSLNPPATFSRQGSGAGGAADTDSDAIWIVITTGATAGNQSFIQAITSNQQRRAWDAEYVARIKTGADITNVRYWVGFFSNTPHGASDPTGHLAGFRYDTGVDGTAFWRTCTKDGTTLLAQASAIAIAASTMYLFRVVLDPAGEVRFFINGAASNVHDTNLPGVDTDLGFSTGITTLTDATRSWRYSRTWGRQRG